MHAEGNAGHLDFGQVHARTHRGVVSLTGTVADLGVSAHVSQATREIHGIRAVRNELMYDATDPTSDVTPMQRARRGRGFDPGPIDGVIGARTEAALRAYQ
jgi:peptidoglycan hydrolase-like protein with peptidoglycan-binding domain